MSNKGLGKEVLNKYSKEELVARVIQLEFHVKQLKNVLSKKDGIPKSSEIGNKKKKEKREFDFRRYNKRHIALKISYFGWDYHGLVVQEETTKTIEGEVFAALHKVCLIESRESSNYHRCGRTDKGVSSFGQVLSLDVRSNLVEGPGLIPPIDSLVNERTDNPKEEFNYSAILNKVLPPEIRVLAWASVPSDFSARFNCIERTYKYYFPRGNLNIEAMQHSCQSFIGEHDFRNFCKMDVGNGVVEYTRRIYKMNISPLQTTNVSPDDGYRMFELVVVGQAFLWHQIRCMVAILFLIGQGLESPDIIPSLLDVNKNPCKPQFNISSELPLVLYDCCYENVNWEYDLDANRATISHFQTFWSQLATKTEIVRQILGNLESIEAPNKEVIQHQAKAFNLNSKHRVYKPLMTRPTCESLESRLEHKAKRSKMDFDKPSDKC